MERDWFAELRQNVGDEVKFVANTRAGLVTYALWIAPNDLTEYGLVLRTSVGRDVRTTWLDDPSAEELREALAKGLKRVKTLRKKQEQK